MLLQIPHFLQNIDIDKYNNSNIKNNFSYEFLNNNLCGLTCLQMCIKYFNNIDISLLSIFEKSLKYNVIDMNKGILHYNLLQFAKAEFDLNGCLIKEERQDRFITLIQFLLHNNIAVLASVKQGMQNTEENCKIKSGHLILIKGFESNNNMLYINDPDNISNYSKLNKVMSINRFFYNFSGNLICVGK